VFTGQLKLKVVAQQSRRYPGPAGPGLVFAWSDELELDGHPNVPAGTHSGISTTVREVAAGDQYIRVPGGGAAELIQYEATYRLLDVPAIGLQKGQITARGVILYQFVNGPVPVDNPVQFAITGGTGPYNNARGDGIQDTTPQGDFRILNIV
jgi:hypothetical protein